MSQCCKNAGLIVADREPVAVAIGEAAPCIVVSRGAERVGERAGVAVFDAAVPDRPEALRVLRLRGLQAVPVHDRRIARRAHAHRVREAAAVLPGGAAVIPIRRPDFAAPEAVGAERHAPAADRPAPEDAARRGSGTLFRRLRDGRLHLDPFQILAQDDIDRSARGVSGKRPDGGIVQNLDALDHGERNRVEILQRTGPSSVDEQDHAARIRNEQPARAEEVRRAAQLQQLQQCVLTREGDILPVDHRHGAQRRGADTAVLDITGMDRNTPGGSEGGQKNGD